MKSENTYIDHSSVKIKREEVTIIDFYSCPYEIQEAVKESKYNFHRDTYLEYLSNLSPSENETWNNLSMERIEKYWKDQSSKNNYQGSLENFIKDYSLTVDKWFIEQGFDFTGIKTILFKV